jgi:dienelactone hydrolase
MNVLQHASAAIVVFVSLATPLLAAEPLPGTQPLEMQGDLADQMVAGIDRFLLRKLKESIGKRGRHWQRDVSSPEKYNASVMPNRARLVKILGAQDQREQAEPRHTFTTASEHLMLAANCEEFAVARVHWPSVRGIEAAGLLLNPMRLDGEYVANVVVIPDADQTPEQLAGIAPGLKPDQQIARRLAECGCRVLVPALINRSDELSAIGERKTNQPHREFLYRPAFEMGRHIIGYELQKVLAAVDWFAASKRKAPIGVVGYGEGGLLALHAAALDPRIDAALVSGYFGSRQNVWQEPIYRNVFGLLDQFGDAELASLIAPRALVVEACRVPDVAGPPAAREGRNNSAAPGRLVTPELSEVQAEVERAKSLVKGLTIKHPPQIVASGNGSGEFFTPEALKALLTTIDPQAKIAPAADDLEIYQKESDVAARQKEAFDQINADTQHLLREGEYVREALWSKADRNSHDLAKWSESTKAYREHFYNDVIGRFEEPLLPANPRSRQVYDETLYTGHEVVLDVFPDVFAYGILLLPKGMKPGEKRPVVVCQHGLEGRPTDVADPKKVNPAYNQYACRLAERGFIVYAPQNPYIFTDRFRTLQRKANPLGKTLYSIIVPQHQQLVNWLSTLPQVDPQRIGFYGLSYGGKTAMRVPALVDGYCLSICSADFNEWIWKNASTRSAYSYVATGEYEIFEFDLGNTYNYAEMAALIAPRPFMVERGHHDGVAPDPWVAYEYAKIRNLYADLRIPERTEIEFFDGPHTIHGVGTFDFLHRHLKWPQQLNR